jgi:hypothetical protein
MMRNGHPHGAGSSMPRHHSIAKVQKNVQNRRSLGSASNQRCRGVSMIHFTHTAIELTAVASMRIPLSHNN